MCETSLLKKEMTYDRAFMLKTEQISGASNSSRVSYFLSTIQHSSQSEARLLNEGNHQVVNPRTGEVHYPRGRGRAGQRRRLNPEGNVEVERIEAGEGYLWSMMESLGILRLSRVDSDFVPFLHHAGVPSIDLYFGSDFPVYHTAFDSYEWMMKSGDPLFHSHVAVVGVLGLVALRLTNDPILPFNYLSYSTELQNYKNILGTILEEAISLDPITDSIQEFTMTANETQEEIKKLRLDQIMDESTVLRRCMLNDRLMLTERGFLDSEGLPGRQWFKHLIYGPRGNTESKMAFFPGVGDAMAQDTSKGDKEAMIRHEIWRVARAIRRAAFVLRGEIN